MKRYRYFLLLSLLLTLSLSACSRSSKPSAAPKETETPEPMLHVVLTDDVLDDSWKKDGFAYETYDYSKGNVAAPFQEVNYVELTGTEPDFAYSSRERIVSFLRDIRYELTTYTIKDNGSKSFRYFLEFQESDSEAPRQIELFTNGELADERLLNMDVVTESDIAVLCVQSSQKSAKTDDSGEEKKSSDSLYHILHLDADGNITSRADLNSCYKKSGIDNKELSYYWWCDEKGNSYAIDIDKFTLYIFSAEGEQLLTHKLSANRGETIPVVCHAPDGCLLFAWEKRTQADETSIFWFDLSVKEPKCLATLPVSYFRTYTMEKNGRFLYGDESNAWLWDSQTGEVKRLLDYSGTDLHSGAFVRHLSVKPNGELLLYTYGVNGEPDALYAMSDQIPEEAPGILLVDFAKYNHAQKCAATFSRRRVADEKIQYQYIEYRDRDDAWTRIMAEFAAGKGPDILCLQATDEHFDTLWEKGILEPMDDWIPQETRKHIFPGLLASGTIDGRLAGISAGGNALVVITSDSFCPGDSWTQQDVLDIIRKNPGVEDIFRYWDGAKDPVFTLDFLVLKHLENSPFIDWENGESHFESREFQDILELCRKYDPASPADREFYTDVAAKESLQKLKDGRCIAFITSGFGHNRYCEFDAAFDGHIRYLGYPGQTDGTGYWNDVNLLVVNARTAHMDAVKEFVCSLFDPKNMEDNLFGMPGRDDVLKDWLQMTFDVMYPNYDIEDYIAFMRDLGPCPRYGGTVSEIVKAEAEEFFNGNRDAAKTAEIIDNRVQLYLNEHK